MRLTHSSDDLHQEDVAEEVESLSPLSSHDKAPPSETTFVASPCLLESHTIQCSGATSPNHLSIPPVFNDPASLFGPDIDSLLASLGPLPTFEAVGPKSLPPASYAESLDILDEVALMTEPGLFTCSSASSNTAISTESQALHESRPCFTDNVDHAPNRWGDSDCHCLTSALGSLNELSTNASNLCTMQNFQDGQSPIQSALVDKERMVKAVDNVLRCPCSQDGYLLTILALIVFKILDWYAAAGRAAPAMGPSRTSHQHHQDQTLNNYWSLCYQRKSDTGIENKEDFGRVAAQMVLGELHRAQKLVNKLSTRLGEHKLGHTEEQRHNDSTGITNNNLDAIKANCKGGGSTRPFSMITLNQLEIDLRRRLRTVSAGIVDELRRT